MSESKITIRVLAALFLLTFIASVYLIIKTPKASNKEESVLTDEISGILNSSTAAYPNNTIAVLNIMSPISYSEEGDYFGIRKGGAIYWIDLLKSVEDNPNVKAVILRVNSPGGTVAATQEVYNTVKRLRAKGKIVTVSMGDIAASGAYYISCAADYIVANPGTLTGSIGVIMAGIDLSDLFKKFGISYNVIKSGKNKDLIAPYRKMTKEEYSLLEEVVMDTYSQFFGAVAEGRKIEPDNLRELADGRIFSGRQALKFKLVDELGDFEKTVTVTAKLSKITGEPNVIDLKPDSGGILRYLTSFADKTVNARQNVTLLETPLSRLHSASPILYMTDF